MADNLSFGFTVKAGDLRDALKAVLPFAGTDDTLPMLRMVQIRAAGTELVLTTTDRYMMARRIIILDAPASGSGEMLLDREIAESMTKWPRSLLRLPVDITVWHGSYQISFDGTVTTIPENENAGSFPSVCDKLFGDFRPADDDGGPGVLRFTPAHIARFAKIPAAKENYVQLTMPSVRGKAIKWEIGETYGMMMGVHVK